MRHSVGFWLLVLLGGTVALVFLLERVFPGTLDDPDTRMQIIYRVGWIALIGASVLAFARARPKSALRNAAIWAVIFVGLTGIISFKDDVAFVGKRFMGGLSPMHGMAHDDGSVSFPAGPDGHFYVQALVNGKRVSFMVDTGATDIVLAPKDARRVGFDPDMLRFDRIAQTANGTVRGASIRLNDLVVGPIAMASVPATVNGADMPESLLGMAFLNRLTGWRVERGQLTLVP